MRIAAVGDIHGRESLGAVATDLDRLRPVGLSLLAGDTTDRNDLEAYDAVLRTIRDRVAAPIAAVFGNNEYSDDHPTYLSRFADRYKVRFLQDDDARFSTNGTEVRVVGSLGCLDRPTCGRGSICRTSRKSTVDGSGPWTTSWRGTTAGSS